MDEHLEPIEDALEFSEAYFVPSNLTKGLAGVAFGVASGLVSAGAFTYAIHKFKQVKVDEVQAMIRGVDDRT